QGRDAAARAWRRPAAGDVGQRAAGPHRRLRPAAARAGRADRGAEVVPGGGTGVLNWSRALGIAGPTGPAVRPTTFVWGDQDVAIGPTAAFGCGRWVTADFEFA